MAVPTVSNQIQDLFHHNMPEYGQNTITTHYGTDGYPIAETNRVYDTNGYSDEEGETNGYDREEGDRLQAAPVNWQMPINVNVTSGPQDGPEGYFHHGPYPVVAPYIQDSFQRTALRQAFGFRQINLQTTTWADHAMHTLGTHFGRVTVDRLGNGSNSSVFLMQQEGSQAKQVLRVFPIRSLRHEHLSQAYQLHRDHVGGEWLSATVNHPNLANNSHIIAWDSSDNSFRVMSREDVRQLVENRHTLAEGRRIYAVATLGEYVEGSRDLANAVRTERYFPEETLRPILHDIFQGVAELNSRQIVHRDLKSANVIVLPSRQAQIIDFGNAGILNHEQTLDVFGDRSYHPPESNITIYGTPIHTSKKTDSYGLFLLTYHALTGESYYGAKQVNWQLVSCQQMDQLKQEENKSFRQILNEDPKLAHVSPTLKDLMAQLGTAKKAERITAEQAMTHPFFLSHYLVNWLDTTI